MQTEKKQSSIIREYLTLLPVAVLIVAAFVYALDAVLLPDGATFTRVIRPAIGGAIGFSISFLLSSKKRKDSSQNHSC